MDKISAGSEVFASTIGIALACADSAWWALVLFVVFLVSSAVRLAK